MDHVVVRVVLWSLSVIASSFAPLLAFANFFYRLLTPFHPNPTPHNAQIYEDKDLRDRLG